MLDATSDEEQRDQIEDALSPPNRVNPATGLPYGWSEDDELDSLPTSLVE